MSIPTFDDTPRPIVFAHTGSTLTPSYTLTIAPYRTGSGDGRGGNARDRRRARRAGRLWRPLENVIRDAGDAPDASRRAVHLIGEKLSRELSTAVWEGTP